MSAEQPWLDDAEAGSAPWTRDMEVGALDRSVPNAPHGIVNAIISGLESSASGLTYRGELPSQTLPQDSTWGERAAAGIAGILADLPYSVAGVIGGGAAGTAAAPGVGTVLGAAAGAVGVPMAVREALMTAYAQGGVHSWSDAWEVTKASVEGLGKGGLIGLATAGAGRAATVAGAGTVQRTAVEIAALTSAGAALEGRLPTFQDITDAAIVVGGIHGAVKIAQGISNIYARTGVKPSEVALDSMRDPSIKADLQDSVTPPKNLYHGSAAEFPEFSMSKVGTGEGAQAYGWGLYFAERKSTAEWYANTVGGKKGAAGNLYEVRAKVSDYRILDLDAPLAQQPPGVKAALLKMADSGPPWMRDFFKNHYEGDPLAATEVRGRALYEFLADGPGMSPKTLSETLNMFGVEGLRYFDSASRKQQAGPRNYVLFDTKVLEISNGPKIPRAYEAKALEESVKAAVPEVLDRATAARFAENPFAPLGQAKGEPTRPTHINYNYINGEAELSGVLSRLSGLYEKQIQTARRGVVPIEQTLVESRQVLADMLGTTADKVPSAGGVQPAKLAATLQAKRQLAVDAAQELKAQGKTLADLGANATEAQVTQYLAHTERASMILADFLGMRAEVARAQNSLKAIVSSSMDLTAVQKLLDSHGGKGKVLDFARIMADADNPTSILRAAQALVKPTLFEKSVEIWKASILSGPTTHLANLFGNTVSTVMKFPERLTAAAIGKLHGGEKVTVAEVRALASGMGQGSLDALKLAGQAASDAIRLKETLPNASKTEQYRNAVGGKTGEFVRIPFKLLTAGDLLFRTLNERGEAHALAVRQAVKEDFAPGTREFGARVVDLVQNPTEAMTKAIIAAGDKATFTTKLGARGAHLQMVVKGSPAEFMLPFIKTPVNLLKWAAEYTPGVNLLMESVRADLSGKNGTVARDIAVARMIVGSAVATVVIEAVDAGLITGGGLADPEKRRAKVAAGWQPYSIKLGGEYYSYQRIDPLARIMSAAADASELYHVAGDNDKLNLAGAITAAVGNATISQTYLSGLANAINAVTDPNRYAGRWLDQYAASLVPGLLGQVAAAIDPQAREVNSMLDAMQARIPILREQLLPKRNPLTGEPIKGTERVVPFAPVTVTEESKDKVLTEAARLGVRLPIAPREVTVTSRTGKLGKVEISPEARNAFTEKQGTFAHEILSRIVNAPTWDAIPDMIKLNIYTDIVGGARIQAALAALPPEARGVEAKRIADELTNALSVAK